MVTNSSWAVSLNGILMAYCSDQETWDENTCPENPVTVLDVLTEPPDGLGLPELRTEDVTYYQRDGVKHFSDWYTPRLVTVRGILGPVSPCSCGTAGFGFGEGPFGEGPFGGGDVSDCECLTFRQQLSLLTQAWKRGCCDTELVIFPPCDGSDDPEERTYVGPFGAVGRPRVFQYQWLNREQQIVQFVARFDAVDQRLYVLDECGTPGYTSCVLINPGTQLMARCYGDDGRCYAGGGRCYNNPSVVEPSVPATDVSVGGTEKVFPEIVFYPPYVNPYAENVTTEEYVWLEHTATDDDSPVTVNTEEGTAFDQEGNSLTHLLRGSLFLGMDPGNYEWRYLSSGEFAEPGYATLCWRDTVVNA